MLRRWRASASHCDVPAKIERYIAACRSGLRQINVPCPCDGRGAKARSRFHGVADDGEVLPLLGPDCAGDDGPVYRSHVIWIKARDAVASYSDTCVPPGGSCGKCGTCLFTPA